VPNAARPRLAAALVAGAVTLAACSGGAGTATTTTTGPPPTETTTTTEPPLEAGEQVYVFEPSIGTCFDRRRIEAAPERARGTTEIVLILDCSLPHEYEVFAVLAPPGDPDEYPGNEALARFARATCVDSFAAFVGMPYERSELEIAYDLPTASAWEQGVRVIGCSVTELDGDKLVGTARGAAR